jgi:hypothetical protein
MSNVLLVSHGYLGDNIFISSVAQKLIESKLADSVDFITGFPQVFELLKQNPYIRDVYMAKNVGPELKSSLAQYDLSGYDKVFTFGPFSFSIPPAKEAQIQCGISSPDSEIRVWTVPEYDTNAVEHISKLRQQNPNKKVVAWMRNWKQKSYKFTEYEYWNAVDNYFTGYGKENRNIDYIVNKLSEHFIMVPVGVPEGISQFDTAHFAHEYNSFAQEASILKHCDYFIGAEGGLANLAAGVGCKTILTYEFIWQCYGPRGTVRPFKDGPMLGPEVYFSEGHAYLPLYKTDEEIINLYIEKMQ